VDQLNRSVALLNRARNRRQRSPTSAAADRATGFRAVCGEGTRVLRRVRTLIGLLAAMLGFTTLAGASFAIAKFLAVVFLILFVVMLVLGMTAAHKITG
jgi:uncharacterized membrane protein YtjA (UPF0391 family)